MRDAPTAPKGEEFVFAMVPRSNIATTRDAQTSPKREEFALGTVPRSDAAAVRDAPTVQGLFLLSRAKWNVPLIRRLQTFSDDEKISSWIWKSSLMARLGNINNPGEAS